MQRQRRRDTAPELALRRELHRRGLRYRVDRAVLPGLRRRADVVFVKARVVCFCDGCFFHQCPEHATKPKANGDWWAAKLAANVERDRDTDRRLTEAGWLVIRVWAHENVTLAADKTESAVRRGLP
jgi:DNA mismatch endonuclease (patch repair protein)